MRTLALAFVALSLLSCSTPPEVARELPIFVMPPSSVQSTPSMQRVIQTATCAWLMDMGGTGSATAFPVASAPHESQPGEWRTLFLSAAHCVEESVRLYGFTLGSGRVEHGILVARHEDQDIAVWEVQSSTPIELAPVALRAPQFGERLYASGWPLGRHLALTEGFQGGDVGSMTAYLIPGNSGGPVIDANGSVVGVAVHVAGFWSQGRPHMGLQTSAYVPLNMVKGWLSSFMTVYGS